MFKYFDPTTDMTQTETKTFLKTDLKRLIPEHP